MKKKECHMIPEEEKQCVWMTTGLISYKLCDRDYRCEECLFDQVMRNEMSVSAPQPGRQAGCAESFVPDDPSSEATGALFYNQHHCWARVENPDRVLVGIDGILAKLVSHVKTVTLPRVGEVVSQGQCFAHIIQQRHIVSLMSPITGSVHATNKQLIKKPGLVVNDPWKSGWLITIQPENLEHDLRTLLFGHRAIQWYHKKEQEMLAAGTAMLAEHVSPLGPTMQDGGEKMTSLADSLTSEQYYQILESLSRADDAV